MKKANQTKDDMRPEYDFATMKGGVRGKYVERLRRESNIVVLDPEVAEAFPTGDSVNAALRGILNTTKEVRTHGGLPNNALQPTTRARRKVNIRKGGRAARG
jgi:hypothetical protein